MDCVADWLATGAAAAEGPEENSCGPNWLSRVIPTTNTSGQKNSHSFRANSSFSLRAWFIALTLALAPVPASARFKEMLFCVKNG
jgi:hypothetical protein